MTTLWKRSVFIPIPKKGNAKECSNYHTIALISHASKVMIKILQARLQQYVDWEIPDAQVGFWRGSGAKDQIANICWIIGKARDFQKNIYFCFIDCVKTIGYVDHILWKILKDMGIPNYFTCLLRNLHAGQEATVRITHGRRDWFKIGKGVCQGRILLLYLFNLYAEYIMRKAGLKVKVKLLSQMDCSLPDSSLQGIFQARVLEWVAISFSMGSSQPRDWTQVSCIAGRQFTTWATREALKLGLDES